MDICIDFDGTCTTHQFPHIGVEIGAASVLKKLTEKGHRLILFTMRSGEHLKNAYDWFYKNDIPLYGVQQNPTQILWTSSPKAYGQMYIDDAALGCPLSTEPIELEEDSLDYSLSHNLEKDGKRFHIPDRPYVDWVKVEKLLKEQEIL